MLAVRTWRSHSSIDGLMIPVEASIKGLQSLIRTLEEPQELQRLQAELD